MLRSILVIVCVCVCVLLCVSTAPAVTKKELNERIDACDKVLEKMTKQENSAIPKDVFQQCKGIAVFPNVLQAGVVLGVSLGKGVVLKRKAGDGAWSKPAFFFIRGGSIGVQAGAQYFDLVLIFITEVGIEGLLEGGYTLGADMTASAGPISRKASKSTSTRFDSAILSYSLSKGLFAGIALKGSVLEPDDEANKLFHGKGVSVQDILYEGAGEDSQEAQALVKRLTDLSQ
jgi:lipid-binding SYLF domain-containing protein